MKKLVLSLTIVLGCALSSIHAQDAQFSQLENLPLLTNPATTGLFTSNDINLGAVYRNQWSSLSSSINSFALSFDLPPIIERWGIGAYLKNTDEIGIINTFSFLASGSYIISNPSNNKDYINSAGL